GDIHPPHGDRDNLRAARLHGRASLGEIAIFARSDDQARAESSPRQLKGIVFDHDVLQPRLAAADKVYYLHPVARMQQPALPFAFGDDRAIDLDRNPALAQFEPLHERAQPRVVGDGVRFAVKFDLKGGQSLGGHDESRIPGAEKAAFSGARTLRFALPYAGITRIRFKGFSCEFSVLAHTPSFDFYITAPSFLSKMNLNVLTSICRSGAWFNGGLTRIGARLRRSI